MPHILSSYLSAKHWDAAIVTSLPNVRYLTGFTGSNGIALVLPDEIILYTDPRYTIQSGMEFSGRVVIAKGSLEIALKKPLSRMRMVAFENETIRYQSQLVIAGLLPKRATMEGMGSLLEELRMVKRPDEIAAIRKAVHINSRAFDVSLKRFKRGMTERELAAEIDYQMRQLGAEKPAFDTIVAFGEHSALPHAHPRDAKIDGNGILLIDMGAFWRGYASDMTRVAHLGPPSRMAKAHYRAVLDSLEAAEAFVKPGVAAKTVDSVARRVLQTHGMDKLFTHSTGHGLGLEIHEPPRVGRKTKTRLCAGMAITIEPGVYSQGALGVRIEDTILVTETGAEILTPTSKEMPVL